MPRLLGIRRRDNWFQRATHREGHCTVSLPWDELAYDPDITSVIVSHVYFGWIGADRYDADLLLTPGDMPQAKIPTKVAEIGCRLPVALIVPLRQSLTLRLVGDVPPEADFWIVVAGAIETQREIRHDS